MTLRKVKEKTVTCSFTYMISLHIQNTLISCSLCFSAIKKIENQWVAETEFKYKFGELQVSSCYTTASWTVLLGLAEAVWEKQWHALQMRLKCLANRMQNFSGPFDISKGDIWHAVHPGVFDSGTFSCLPSWDMIPMSETSTPESAVWKTPPQMSDLWSSISEKPESWV